MRDGIFHTAFHAVVVVGVSLRRQEMGRTLFIRSGREHPRCHAVFMEQKTVDEIYPYAPADTTRRDMGQSAIYQQPVSSNRNSSRLYRPIGRLEAFLLLPSLSAQLQDARFDGTKRFQSQRTRYLPY